MSKHYSFPLEFPQSDLMKPEPWGWTKDMPLAPGVYVPPGFDVTKEFGVKVEGHTIGNLLGLQLRMVTIDPWPWPDTPWFFVEPDSMGEDKLRKFMNDFMSLLEKLHAGRTAPSRGSGDGRGQDRPGP